MIAVNFHEVFVCIILLIIFGLFVLFSYFHHHLFYFPCNESSAFFRVPIIAGCDSKESKELSSFTGCSVETADMPREKPGCRRMCNVLSL